MQQHLQFIQDFSNTIAATFKQFAQLCRVHLRKAQQSRPQFVDVQNQLIQERKKRLELEEIIKQKVSGASQGQPSENPPSQQERKRPKTAFQLFVTDQREKILKEHPTLDLYKITSLAAIKWKKLSREQQLVYQKKLEEINKIPDDQLALMRNRQMNNDAVYVKKQFGHEDEDKQAENGMANKESHQQEEPRPRQEESSESNNNQPNNEGHDNQNEPNHNQNEVMATMMIENEYENQATQKIDQEQFRQKQPLENILDLFHTQQRDNYEQDNPKKTITYQEQNQDIINKHHETGENNIAEEEKIHVNIMPSVEIYEPATSNHPIVIPPTVQQEQQ